MGNETSLTFKSEDDRQLALVEIPDEPPQGVDIEEWQREQDEKVKEILNAPISEEAASDTVPKTENEDPPATGNEEEPSGKVEDDDYVDFTEIGKIKRSELPEILRSYENGKEILKQAAHARRYANQAEDKIRSYEQQIEELKSTAQNVPDLQKQLNELKKASDTARTAADQKPMGTRQRSTLNNKLDTINSTIQKLKDYGGEDVDALQSAISTTVDAFKETMGELDGVRNEFSRYRQDSENKYNELRASINKVSETSKQAEERRKFEVEQKKAERSLAELQSKYPELKTTKPLYADDRNDVESSIVKMARRVYGREPRSFDEVNRMVGSFNTKDPELMRICASEGISPADFGLNERDIRNYGILMNVYWQQRGERIDPHSGKRVPVTDFRGQKVTYPDFEATFSHIKDSSGLSQAEKELEIINAEKQGQENLNESLKKRDTSSPTLDPTGAPPEGATMSEDMALEVIGEKVGRMTVDEELMERLLRIGDKRGWAMFESLKQAHEALGMPIPDQEQHWVPVT